MYPLLNRTYMYFIRKIRQTVSVEKNENKFIVENNFFGYVYIQNIYTYWSFSFFSLELMLASQIGYFQTNGKQHIKRKIISSSNK